jgi:hypothetical protein
MRCRAPSPVPELPTVECPSRMLAATFAMPGPRSIASTSTPDAWSRSRTRITTRPRFACLWMLVAASVTATASPPAAVSSSRASAASAAASRRAAAMPLASAISTAFCRARALPPRGTLISIA